MHFSPFTSVQAFCLEHLMLHGINVFLGNIIGFSFLSPDEESKVSINFAFSSKAVPWVRSELGQGQKYFFLLLAKI